MQLDNRYYYKHPKVLTVKKMQEKVNEIINQMHRGKHINDMTTKWLTKMPYPPTIPSFYMLMKIQKPTPV